MSVLSYYSCGPPRCACCDERGWPFLSIDHINRNGAAHRREIGPSKKGYAIYCWLKKNNFPPGFQVLCHNCNMAREHWGGVCPHKTGLIFYLK